MWRAGQPRAGDRLCRRYMVKVRRYFNSKADNEEDAKELTAQTFAALHERVHDIREPDKFPAFLFGIARNRERKYSAKKGRVRSIEKRLEHAPQPHPLGPWTMLERRRESRLIRDGIRSLPQELQEVVLLAYAEGLKSPAIGDRLRIPAPTVRSRLRRARQELRKYIQTHPERELRDSTLTNFGSWAKYLLDSDIPAKSRH